MDEEGTIRLLKQGFRVTEAEHTEAVEKLIRGEVEKVDLDDHYYEPKNTLLGLELQLAQTRFKLGMEYSKTGKKLEALHELDAALRLDPDNFLIRKQRWYIRHPEKFTPTIDIDWQQEQLKAEKEEESKLQGLDCGPEGCMIPGTEQK
ncbi:thioredoxin family protein [Bacillus sp. AK128]